MNFTRRLLATLSLGYVLYFYSEFAFWGRWKTDDTITGAIMTWLIYSVLAFFVLLMAERFKADSAYSIFLVGAVFGWLVEGVIVQEAYMAFPFQLVWTPLAWHALISVLIGTYFARRAIGEWSLRRAAALFAGLGVFLGLWATYWKLEDGYSVSVGHFAAYTLISTVFLVVAYFFLDLTSPKEFIPTRWEVGAFGAVVAFFALFTFMAVPFSPLVLLPLLALTLYALKGLKGEKSFLKGSWAPAYRYLLPLIIPLFAVPTYAVLRDVWFEVNVPVALVTSGAGLFLYVKGIYLGLKTRRSGKISG
ncbi:hypothetical protein PFDSM3638_03625 [Pyrococcus furiosus DSM 3638]|uniref:Uncharacterized protein n=3 Tax=Pyrococcus furiosus TaxID=2261 RepID=A0A5C0XMU2_PYRFU|nr:hypothetical protein [Pyrococcus furiosus]AAL80854.1 hypothetical protein PF0730 [Pyrococcus furiosus DSM 3638]AFN03518.1 hypothetical protein PFC_02795 [Pyrococcus furiosus COM1]QEK78416.1 hypothetical protein PFDSM3638_03625 [Pyrococcus furiosus DSM 3638]